MKTTIAENRKALHTYEILDTFEAGLVLTGAEIKAIRAHKLNLAGSYARLLTTKNVDHPELFWVGGSITTLEGDAQRSRKLLLHQQELTRLIGKLQEKGLTLVPLRLYLNHGYAKLQLGLGRGKKLHDKRRVMIVRDKEREAARATKQRRESRQGTKELRD